MGVPGVTRKKRDCTPGVSPGAREKFLRRDALKNIFFLNKPLDRKCPCLKYPSTKNIFAENKLQIKIPSRKTSFD